MKVRARQDRPTTQAALILLAGALLAVAALGHTAVRWHRASTVLDGMNVELANVEARSARARLRAAESERLQGKIGAFAAAGLVSNEGAASWRSAVRHAQKVSAVADVAAEVIGEGVSHPKRGPEAAGLRIRESRVRLRIGALHEEELLRFLDALREARAGVLSVRRCSLRRVRNEPDTHPMPMDAQCEVVWTQAVIAEPEKRR